MSSLHLYAQPKLVNYTELKAPFEKILCTVQNDLSLDTAAVNIFVRPSVLDKNFPDDGQATITYDNKGYNVNLNETLSASDQAILFLHELVHISQIRKKELVIKRCYVWYKGEVFTGGIYETLPYEKEAVRISNILYRKYHIQNIL